jgi:Archaeal TRASH domain
MRALVLLVAFPLVCGSQERNSREILKPFNLLVGSWKGTGLPEGSPEERQKGHWQETVHCEWKFRGADVWIEFRFENGKHFASGELRAKGAGFEFVALDAAKQKRTYAGEFKDKLLTLDLTSGKPDEASERIVVSLLHDNRILYRQETRSAGGTLFTKKYQVGLTKIGVPFVEVGADPRECIVSGGRGTSTVIHDGKTYYVCCSGCRDEFKADPTRYIKEWEARKKK